MLCCTAFVAGMTLTGAPAPAVALCGLTAVLLLTASAITSRIAPGLFLPALALAFAACGGLVHQTRTALPDDDISLNDDARNLTIRGTVVGHPEDRGWYQRLQLRVERVTYDCGASRRVSGRTILRTSSGLDLTFGDRLIARGASIKLPPTVEEPGEFDYRAWLRRRGVTALMNAREVEVIGRDRGWRTSTALLGRALRERVSSGIEEAMPGVDGAFYSRLLIGMVYGLDAGRPPADIVEQFRRAGTIHLLVVSGAQVSIIALAIAGLAGLGRGRRTGRRLRWWQVPIAIVLIGALVLIVGMEASIGRAVAMFVLIAMASLTSRDYDVYTALAFAAAIICLFDPHALHNLGFQLTFAATLGIVLFLPPEPIRRVSNDVAAPPLPQLRAVVWATAGAWVMTAPILAHSIAQFAISGNLANLVNVPLSVMIRVLGFIALPVSLLPWATPLMVPICWLARGLLRMVIHVNALAISLPLAFAHDLQISLAGVFLCYLGVVVLFALGAVQRVQRWLDERLLRLHPSSPTIGIVSFVTLLTVSYVIAGTPPGQLEMAVLPVGAGQCVVIRTPEGRSLMVDGGSGSHASTGDEVAGQIILPHLVARRIQRLDAVVVSHWHADHYNALPRVFDAIGVDLILLPPEVDDFRPPDELRHHVQASGRRAVPGGLLTLDETVSVRVLAPRFPLLRGTGDDPNNNSVVVMVEHNEVRFLLPGDLEPEGVIRLLRDAHAAGWSLRADVLLLPHHGRDLMGVLPLLDAVRPRWAIASSDYQADDYLCNEALAQLQQRGIRLLRTDEHGKVSVFSDGHRLRTTTTRGSRAHGAWLGAMRQFD